MSDDRRIARERMVELQLAARDITDERVLAAMLSVPRHEFVPAALQPEAYDDRPLPIGHGATISQPYIVALMAQELRLSPTDRVLEIGTGSGYAAAVLAELAAEIVTVECVDALVAAARRAIGRHCDNVTVVVGDGSLGWPDLAPYDAISVTAAAPDIPPPLLDQLAPDGRLLIPVGAGTESLTRVTRTELGDQRDDLLPVTFVALTGEFGQP